ncbi:MAG TPA: DUF1343 domain-containing protein [Bacteroidota bacterium]
MKLETRKLFLIALALVAAGAFHCSTTAPPSPVAREAAPAELSKSSAVKVGADVLFEKHFNLIEGKRIGLVMNHSALLADGRHLADALHDDSRTTLVALFGPEHGIRGNAAAGDKVRDTLDARTNVPVYSLYGSTTKPTPYMLRNVDVLLFDIQNVGARFYTFESTLSLAMEAAAENRIPFVVLDRPNPIRGTWVEGFVREDSLASFVGMHAIPIAHGMTMGELASMINGNMWMPQCAYANFTVVPMEGWQRTMWYDETGLTWVPPSPNIPFITSSVVYPGMCLVEGTNVSEGRGTQRPFETIGAPYINGRALAKWLNDYLLPGVLFEPTQFTPREIPGVASNPKYKDVLCGGVYVHVTDRNAYEPVKTAVYLLSAVKQLYPREFQWRTRAIDLLAGTPKLRLAIDAGTAPAEICNMWVEELETFKRIREPWITNK